TAVYAGTYPAVAVAGMAVAAMIILDPAYRRICTEAEWFGLDDYKL
ncbi:MAG TPA: hypothetical protein GXZ80_01965, partial [Euryarchaeota archaeon]|nr:hypothetical protein [Euryarchaeota archaeon]